MVTLIGPRGGGKTLFAVYRACMVKNTYPDIPVVANFKLPIKGCYYVPDILDFLRQKIARKNTMPAEFLIDEASIAGLESRESHGQESIFNTRPLALSRKAQVNIWLISQMMSMMDKRAQWLADFDVLCEPHYETEASYELHIPDYFEYTFYNQNREITNQLNIYGQAAYETLFDLYNTDEVPNEDQITASFISYGRWNEDNTEEFYKIIKTPREIREEEIKRFRNIVDRLNRTSEEIEEELGPWIKYLSFQDNGKHVELENRENGKDWSKNQWQIFHNVLKEAGYKYIPANEGGPAWRLM